MDYRVYVRYENNPAVARKNAEEKPDGKYGPTVLDAVFSADPGDEGSILQEALDEARLSGKYVALYRGQPAGLDRHGGELFVPVGLAWCKDSEELAMMIGVPPQLADRHAAVADSEGMDDKSKGYWGSRDNNGVNGEIAGRSKYKPRQNQNRTLKGNSGQVGKGRQGSSWGRMAWVGIFLGCFVVSFAIVYGAFTLLGR